jgi:hypothetical protein
MNGIDTLVDADCSHVNCRANFGQDVFDEEQKRISQRGFARSLGVGGLFELDDLQNWSGITSATAGQVGMSLDHDFTGCPNAQPSTEIDWPGLVCPRQYTDVMFRELFREWARMMEMTPLLRGTSVAVTGAAA